VVSFDIIVHVAVRILSALWLNHDGSVCLHLPRVVDFNRALLLMLLA